MSNILRIQTLYLSCLIIVLTYGVVQYIVFLYEQCWTYTDFWHNNQSILSPYNAFTAIMSLMFIWALAEVYSLYSMYKISRKRISIALILLIMFFSLLAIVLGFTHFTLAQMLQIHSGTALVTDFKFTALYESYEIHSAQWAENAYSPDWFEFLYDERCNKGLDLNNITEQELEVLRQKHNTLIENAYDAQMR